MANELEPSTLEPLMPAAAPAAKTGMGAKAAWPTICDLVASFESAVLEQPVHRKGRFAGQEVGFHRVLIRRDRAWVAQAIIDGLLHPGQDLNALLVIEDGLAAGIQEGAAVPEEQHGEITDHAFLLIP